MPAVTDFNDGLSDRAPILMREADAIRTAGIAAAGPDGVLPYTETVKCARLLASACASCAYWRYPSSNKPPVLLGTSILQTLFLQFSSFPSNDEVPPIDAFNRDAYHRLKDYAIDAAKFPDVESLDERAAISAATSLQSLGAQTLRDIVELGKDSSTDTSTQGIPQEDADGINISTCMLGAAQACRVSLYADKEFVPDGDASAMFIEEIVEAHSAVIAGADEVSAQRKEVVETTPKIPKSTDKTPPRPSVRQPARPAAGARTR